MIETYRTAAQFDAAADALRGYWDTLLSNYHAETGDEKVDRMVNIWNQYQCMVTFNMSRSASYFESGMGRGMGFRDSCQDLLGFVHIIRNGRGAHSGYRRHAVPGRQRLSSVSTAHEEGKSWQSAAGSTTTRCG